MKTNNSLKILVVIVALNILLSIFTISFVSRSLTKPSYLEIADRLDFIEFPLPVDTCVEDTIIAYDKLNAENKILGNYLRVDIDDKYDPNDAATFFEMNGLVIAFQSHDGTAMDLVTKSSNQDKAYWECLFKNQPFISKMHFGVINTGDF